MNNTCITCKTEKCFMPYHKCERCIKCISAQEPNSVQLEIIGLYNISAFNWKYPEVCSNCKKDKIVTSELPYKYVYDELTLYTLEKKFGPKICCECLLVAANNVNLFVKK